MEKLNVNGKLSINKPCKNIVNLSFVYENKEFEVDVYLEDLTLAVSRKMSLTSMEVLDAEIFVHPACCEHEEGCP